METEGETEGGKRRGGREKDKVDGFDGATLFIGRLGTSVAIPFYRQVVDCLLQRLIVY